MAGQNSLMIGRLGDTVLNVGLQLASFGAGVLHRLVFIILSKVWRLVGLRMAHFDR